MIRGAIVALVTPFRDGKVDERALQALIEFQVANGTHAIVPCGTTGESATLSHEEHDRVIALTVEAVAGRIPVYAGTGSNSTAEAIRMTRHAEQVGANGALLVTPYYNKPTQEGLYQHYRAVAESTSLPLILYNVPGRTSVNMLPETVARLAQLKNVVAVKEASGSLAQATEILTLCGEGFSVLSGDDPITLPILAVGGRGIVSVVSNIAPRDVSDLCNAWDAGDLKRARDLHLRMFPLAQAMFLETNPIPVKTALAMMGKITEEFRSPLCPMAAGTRAKLDKVLREYGLLGAGGK
ncbi:MAG: 4-hydroxy-tetrahydrodipicolinate synthase [Deltaproteobacteria bacterium]|nr:4-hydroxy-tetrahydrodipicolinate synthase [Deltaproteobacteria bacterium]